MLAAVTDLAPNRAAIDINPHAVAFTGPSTTADPGRAFGTGADPQPAARPPGRLLQPASGSFYFAPSVETLEESMTAADAAAIPDVPTDVEYDEAALREAEERMHAGGGNEPESGRHYRLQSPAVEVRLPASGRLAQLVRAQPSHG